MVVNQRNAKMLCNSTKYGKKVNEFNIYCQNNANQHVYDLRNYQQGFCITHVK